MRFTSWVVAALLVTTGCVGSEFDDGGPGPTPDGGGGGGGAAKALYTSTVHPIMLDKCDTTACHGQPTPGLYGFAIPDANSGYTQLTSLPTVVGTYTMASAGLVTKIKQPGGHNAVMYSMDDETKIGAWLAKEAQERSGGMPPIDPVALLQAWTGCMSIENFEAANMPTAWGQLAAANQQRCANCHAAGLDLFLSGSGDAQPYFLGLSTTKDFLTKYFTVDATGAIIINTASMQNAGTTLPGHPRFNALTNQGMTALQEFYNLTKTRQTAGTPTPCGPSTLTM